MARTVEVEIVGKTRDRELETYARNLLLAMERMHGNFTFSRNVCEARDDLAYYLDDIAPLTRDIDDEAQITSPPTDGPT